MGVTRLGAWTPQHPTGWGGGLKQGQQNFIDLQRAPQMAANRALLHHIPPAAYVSAGMPTLTTPPVPPLSALTLVLLPRKPAGAWHWEAASPCEQYPPPPPQDPNTHTWTTTAGQPTGPR